MNVAIKKLIGIEVEFGNHLYGHNSARGDEDFYGAARALCQAHKELFGLSTENKYGCKAGLDEFGTHQFRCYPDHAHAEISSPLTADAKDLVLWQMRAKKLIGRCQKHAQNKYNHMYVHCANTNRNGAAWGFHMNLLVSRRAFNKWRDRNWHPLFAQWIPFLVTSPVLFGTGKVGAENNRPKANYQLSQRADFIDEVVKLETVCSKSLINERDEPLADPARYARFHITAAFDFNCCEFASWLKFGLAQVMIALIEAGVELPNLQLKDPLDSLATVSRDLEMGTSLELETRTYRTALEIQEELAFSASRAINAGIISEEVVPSAKGIVNAWIITLNQLQRRDPLLRRRLDWLAKKQALDQWRHRLGASWDDLRLTELDLRYAGIGNGWFERFERNHLVDRLEDFLPVNDIEHKPSSCARDVARGRILEKFRKSVLSVNWHYVCVNTGQNNRPKIYKINLDDPLDAAKIHNAIDKAQTVSELLEYLPKHYYHCVECDASVNLLSY